ncbi:MAG TPA: hypothetical protein VG674_33030 [Amycolatopsis sp.]|nr:hypothetical protein [Amycolatopsis sp.]
MTVLAALVTGLGIGLVGCGQQPPVSQTQAGGHVGTASPADPAARWADGYCTAVTHLVRTLAGLPTIDPSTPAHASRSSSRLLSSVVDGIDQTVAELDRVGPPPVAGGDKARTDLLDEFSSVRSRADSARERLDTATDAATTERALGDARSTLDDVANLDLLQALNATPALAAAGKRAPGCQQLVVPPAPH